MTNHQLLQGILQHPRIAPKLTGKKDAQGREIAWCIVLPTDQYVRAALTAIKDAIVESDGVNWKDRLAVRVVFSLAARAAVEEMRKVRQADLYALLVEGQKGWSKEVRTEKVSAYRQKLGLGDKFKAEPAPEPTKVKQEEEPGSG